MNQLNAYAPAIVGALSVVIVAVSAVWIASRPPKSVRKQPRHHR